MADPNPAATADTTDEPTATEGTELAATASDTDQPATGPGGRSAIAAERDARKAAEKKIRDLEAQVASLTADKLRGEVATAKGVPAELLSGSTREELEARADALLEFRGSGPAEQAPAPKPRRIGRPVENLRSGSLPNSDGDGFDAAKMADRIFSNK